MRLNLNQTADKVNNKKWRTKKKSLENILLEF